MSRHRKLLALNVIFVVLTIINCNYADEINAEDEEATTEKESILEPRGMEDPIISELAKIEDYPYYAVIRSNLNEDLFDGAIISENYVLTSAVAAKSMEASSIMVHVGTFENTFTEGRIHAVSNVTAHPLHTDKNPLRYNVALLRVRSSFVFDETVNIVRLPDNDKKIRTKDVHKVLKYPCGMKNEYDLGPQTISLVTMTNRDCKNLVQKKSPGIKGESPKSKHVFCAKLNAADLRWDSCIDHTSGLVVANRSLVGVYSYTTECIEQICPVVYTKVFHLLDWIKKNSDVGAYLP